MDVAVEIDPVVGVGDYMLRLPSKKYAVFRLSGLFARQCYWLKIATSLFADQHSLTIYCHCRLAGHFGYL